MNGILHNRCFLAEYDSYSITPQTDLNQYNSSSLNVLSSNIFCVYNQYEWMFDNTSLSYCSQKSLDYNLTSDYSICLPIDDNPNNGLYSFDDIFHSIFNVYVISTGHWPVLMSYCEQSLGEPVIAVYFFMISSLFIYILLPLLLAFLTAEFTDHNLADIRLHLDDDSTLYSCITANVSFLPLLTKKIQKCEEIEEKMYDSSVIISRNSAENAIELQDMSPLTTDDEKDIIISNSEEKKEESSDVSLLRSSTVSIHRRRLLLSNKSPEKSISRSQSRLKVKFELDLDIALNLDSSQNIFDIENGINYEKDATLARFENTLLPEVQQRKDTKLCGMILNQSSHSLSLSKKEYEGIAEWRQRLYTLVILSKPFEYFILGCILCNTITLSIRYHSVFHEITLLFDILNGFFLFIFMLEVIIKQLGMGFRSYWHSSWDSFDGTVVLISIAFFIYHMSTNWNSHSKSVGMSSIIILRLLRILISIRSIAYFESFNYVMIVISDTIRHMLWLMFILLLFIFICAHLCTCLYANNITGGNTSVWNFENTIISMLSVFQISSGQNWIDIAGKVIGAFSIWSIIFFILISILGIFVFPYLFISLALGSIDKYEEEDNDIVQYVLLTTESIRKNFVSDMNENDLRLLIMDVIHQRREELTKRNISDYLFRHRDQNVMFGRSLGWLTTDNTYRVIIHSIVTNKVIMHFFTHV